MEKLRSLRGHEALRERDREMYRKHVEGHTYEDIARFYGRTKGLVSQRFAGIPHTIKLAIRRDVANIRTMRLRENAEQMEMASA